MKYAIGFFSFPALVMSALGVKRVLFWVKVGRAEIARQETAQGFMYGAAVAASERTFV